MLGHIKIGFGLDGSAFRIPMNIEVGFSVQGKGYTGAYRDISKPKH